MATRLVPTLYQVLDGTGNPGNGWKLYFYATGTTTPKDTYSNEALTVANANPVVADSVGRFGDIYGANKEDYKIVLKDSATLPNTIETEDPLDSITYNINSFGTRPAQHWGDTTNTANAYQIKPVPSITSYANDLLFSFTPHLDNNVGCTFAVFKEGTTSTYLSALTMKKYDSAGAKTNLELSDLQSGQSYLARIDLTDCIVLNLIPEATTTVKGVKFINKAITLENGTDTEHDIDFGAGNFEFDTATEGQALATAMTKRIDATWVVGDGNGGLDTGSVANDTWYYLYAIHNPTTKVSDFLFSVSYYTVATPTFPSGYTKSKYICSILTNGSANIIQFFFDERARRVTWDVPALDVSEAPTTTRKNQTLSASRDSVAILIAALRNDNGSGINYGLITEVRQTDTAPGVNQYDLIADEPGGGAYDTFGTVEMQRKVDSSSQIAGRFSLTDGAIKIFTKGFIDIKIK